MEKKIRELIKTSMVNKEKTALLVYKSILENAQKQAKDKKEEVNDTYIISAIKKEIKQLEDLLGYCSNGSEKYAEVNSKIALAKDLLPKMADKEEILEYLEDNNIEKNIGVCMKSLKAHFKDNLDGKLASSVVKEYIGI